MKTKMIPLFLLILLSITSVFAQSSSTRIIANNTEISDNLDLRAVASIFGDSNTLQDFERRLNDPKLQISNLDLNNDNQVDYLRVIETIQNNVHIIVIQSVLGRNTYQDIATIEIQRDRYNKVYVQVVGDTYMYGNNYIYEPVYVSTPIVYASFWSGNYRPYCSAWNWGLYPSYYYTWTPYPVFRYRNHVGLCININNYYNYVNYRRSEVAYNAYSYHRCNGYESQYPDRSFAYRNGNYANRYELDQHRNIRTVGTRDEMVASTPRNHNYTNDSPRGNTNTRVDLPRNLNDSNPRDAYNTRTDSPRNIETSDYSSPRNSQPRTNNSVFELPRNERNQDASPRRFSSTTSETPRFFEPRGGNERSFESPRNSNSGGYSGSRDGISNGGRLIGNNRRS